MSQSSGFKAQIAGKATRKKNFDKDGPRMMLAPCQENQHAMEEYHYQMDLLIEHMFPAHEYSKKLRMAPNTKGRHWAHFKGCRYGNSQK